MRFYYTDVHTFLKFFNVMTVLLFCIVLLFEFLFYLIVTKMFHSFITKQHFKSALFKIDWMGFKHFLAKGLICIDVYLISLSHHYVLHWNGNKIKDI